MEYGHGPYRINHTTGIEKARDNTVVLLVTGAGSDKLLATHALRYWVEEVGKMALVNVETRARVDLCIL